MTPAEFTSYWLAQRNADSKRVDWVSRELAAAGMSARRWNVFFDVYARSDAVSAALRRRPHPASAVRALWAEQTAAAEAALAAAIRNSPALRLAARRTYTRRYWLDVHGGSARENVALRQARFLVAVAAPGWTVEPHWRTSDVTAIAGAMFACGNFSAMPILADALQDAGAGDDEWLSLMRDPDQPWFAGAGVLDTLR